MSPLRILAATVSIRDVYDVYDVVRLVDDDDETTIHFGINGPGAGVALVDADNTFPEQASTLTIGRAVFAWWRSA